jgi:DNA-binding response OmpR family regulator
MRMPRPEPVPPTCSPRTRRVFVIDDDASIQGFLVDALVDDGYVVRTATNGRDALAMLREWRPDLILLDLMLPEMSGWEFRANQLTQPDVANVPVIVLSAMRDPTPKVPGLAPARVVPKPFDLDELLATIDELSAAFVAANDECRPSPPTPPLPQAGEGSTLGAQRFSS